MTRRSNTLIVFVLQGRARVMFDHERGDPHTWDSIAHAQGYLDRNAHEHVALKAAESIVMLDADSGESEVWL